MLRSSSHSSLGLLLAVTLTLGCRWTYEPYQERLFACSQDSECAAGYVCSEGECKKLESDGSTPVPVCEPSNDEDCSDAFDNDCDTLVDCADPGCQAGASCSVNGSVCASGACACSGNGGTPETAEASCGDDKDNDCDGLKDCADSDCAAKACGADGRVCSSAACSCSGNGGAVEATETSCGDTFDNDCDGLEDCADPDCSSASCGTDGETCSGGFCLCSGNGGATETNESVCGDNKDNDCDGAPDCLDADCGAKSCGTNGKLCAAASCSGCSGNGGTPQATESNCSDTKDNDCDGLVDCLDPSCGGVSCGAGNGRTCVSNVCTCSGNGGTAQGTETNCSDNKDNDCDGTADCADSSCGSGVTCGSNGLVCSNSTCVCSGNTGTPQTTESTCNDSDDNDCDGLVDCADSANCNGRTCGAGNGRVCSSSNCVCQGNGGTAQGTESSCTDGFDNDCDGNIDCMDSNCPACSTGSLCRTSSNSCVLVTYAKTTSPDSFIDACALPGRTIVLSDVDDAVTSLLSMPFPFKFFGVTEPNYWVSSNGVVGFRAPTDDDPDFSCGLPEGPGNPEPALFAYADDLDITADDICVGVSGSSPNRKLVITWDDVDRFETAGTDLTFSVVLSETTNTVDYIYQVVTGLSGGSALIGLQNSTATEGTQHSCDQSSSVSSGTKLRFTPSVN